MISYCFPFCTAVFVPILRAGVVFEPIVRSDVVFAPIVRADVVFVPEMNSLLILEMK